MLTLEELQKATINPEVAREAHTQVQKRLEDALATKASHEQKAFALMAAYVTLALAAFTGFGVFAKDQPEFAPALFWTGLLFTAGAGICWWALLPGDYGTLGSDPSVWLRPGVIDGNAKALPFTLAYEVYFHQQRINVSAEANSAKALRVRCAVIAGLIAPLIPAFWLYWL
jgi:hypothetical protein